uniref:(northern house mosquito) hypothetical protein n=1 Tax=Culex pipiens TaxID=7175 RepID=A0A8D8JMB7_CULPI
MGKQQLSVLGGVLLEVAHVRRTVPAMEGTLDSTALPAVPDASVGQLCAHGIRFGHQEQRRTSQQVRVEHLAGPDVVRRRRLVKCFHVVEHVLAQSTLQRGILWKQRPRDSLWDLRNVGPAVPHLALDAIQDDLMVGEIPRNPHQALAPQISAHGEPVKDEPVLELVVLQ